MLPSGGTLEAGWSVKVITRQGGKTAGTKDKVRCNGLAVALNPDVRATVP